LDAANRASSYGPDDCLNDSRFIAAAALRAAVDQVVPEENVDDADYHCLYAKWAAEGKQEVRDEMLAIAAELEGANSRPQNSRYLFGVSVKDQKPPPRLV
jgi:hypothetical protein